MSEYDDLLQRGYAGEFDEPVQERPRPATSGNALAPTDDGLTLGMALRDTALFIPRGVEGAVRETYGLLDTLTMDALPDYKENVLGHSETILGGVAESVAQFGAGMWAMGGALGAVGKSVKGAGWLLDVEASAAASLKAGRDVAKLSHLGTTIAGAAAQFTAFGGSVGRLADLAAQIPGFEEPMNRYLSFALTNEEDGELVGRMKNALEGAGVGAAIGGVVKGVRWLKKFGEAVADGRTQAEAVAHANRSVGALEGVVQEFGQLDDFRGTPSPFGKAQVDDALAKAREQDRLFLNTDGTPSPDEGARFVPLAEAGDVAPHNFLAKYRTLLDNPQATVEFNADGTVRIGVSLNEAQAASEQVKAGLGSLADETPGAIGRRVGQILDQPSKGPTTGIRRVLPKESAATDIGLYQRVGFGTNDAERIAKALGARFEEGLNARGEIEYKVNLKANAPGIKSDPLSEAGLIHVDEPLLFPTRVETDAVNPRKLNAQELLERALTIRDLNLSTMIDLGTAAPMRALEPAVRAALVHDMPALAGERAADMLKRRVKALETILGLPNGASEALFAQQQGRAMTENVQNAAAFAGAFQLRAAMITRSLKPRWEELAAMVARGEHNEILAAEFAEGIGLASDHLASAIGIKNAFARGMWSFRIPFESMPAEAKRLSATVLRNDPEALAKVLSDAGGLNSIEALAVRLAKLGPNVDLDMIAATMKAAELSFGSKAFNATREAWYGAMLSSIRTLTTNLGGNIFGALYHPMEQAVSAKIALQFASRPEEVAALNRQLQVGLGMYSGMWQSMAEAFHIAKVAFKENRNILEPRGAGLTAGSSQGPTAFSAFALGISPETAQGKTVDAMGYLLHLPLRTLRGTDEGVKQLVARGYARSFLREKYAGITDPVLLTRKVEEGLDKTIIEGQILSVRALRDRFQQAAVRDGLDGAAAVMQAETRLSEYMQSAEWQEFSPIANQARVLAREATYTTPQRPPSPRGDPKPIPSMTADVAEAIRRHPGLSFITPFVETPMNLMKFGAQRMDALSAARWYATKAFGGDTSAYARSRMRFLRDMASGDPAVQAAAKGRIIMGSTFATGIYAMAAQGILTGGGPADPAQRKALLDSGWLPYSIRIGDTYYSYARTDPVATIVGTVVDLTNLTAYAPEDKRDAADEIGKGLMVAVSNNLVNKSYMQGIANFVGLLHDRQNGSGKFLQSFLASFVPNIAKDAANVYADLAGQDEALGDVRSALDALIQKTPGLSMTLEPLRNALGEPVSRATQLGSSVTPLANAFVPIGTSQAKGGLDEELARTGFGWQHPPSGRNGYDLVDIKDSNGRSAYDRWQERYSTMRMGGRTLREQLDALVSSPRYRGLSPYNTSDQPSPRINAIQTIISRYRRSAMDQIMREMPNLSAAERNFLLTRRSLRAGVDTRSF